MSLVKSIFCKPQTAYCVHFRIAKLAISLLLIFGFSPEKHERTLKVSTKILLEVITLRKNVKSSA